MRKDYFLLIIVKRGKLELYLVQLCSRYEPPEKGKRGYVTLFRTSRMK